MTGKLYVIPTPIGNRKDMTERAKEVIASLDLLLCEDTRHTGQLLQAYDLRVPLASYHMHNEKSRSDEILDKIREGAVVGLVSDAGMPGMSDPGEVMVRAAREGGVSVEVLPGPSAAVTALVGSGFQALPHLMHGFVSRDNRERKKQAELLALPITHIFYESPKRVLKTLQWIYDTVGDRPICLCRELTKLHEEYNRGTVAEFLANPEGVKEKGEYVLVIGPSEEEEAPQDIEGALREAMQTQSLSKAVKVVSKQLDIPKNTVYDIALTLSQEQPDA